MATYYVRQDGTVTAANKATATDGAAAASSLSPAQFGSCSGANAFSDGDEVRFDSRGGVITGNLNIPVGGSAVGSEITYCGSPGYEATLAPTSGAALNLNAMNHIIVKDLNFGGTATNASMLRSYGVTASTTNVTLDGCTFTGARVTGQGGVNFQVMSTGPLIIRDCTFTNCMANAIYIDACEVSGNYIRISGCTFDGNGEDGDDKNTDQILFTKTPDTQNGTSYVEDCVFINGRGGESTDCDMGRTTTGYIRRCLSISPAGKSFSSTHSAGGATAITVESCISYHASVGLYIYGAASMTARNCTVIEPICTFKAPIGVSIGNDAGCACVLRNCIVQLTNNSSGRVIAWNDANATLDSDYNAWYGNASITISGSNSVGNALTLLQAASKDANSVYADPQLSDNYSPGNSAVKGVGTWIAGVLAYDDLPLPLSPDIGAVQDRTAPGRRFGVGGGKR